MPEPEPQPVLDRLVHEPGRLAILTVLSSVTDADFVFLQRATGLIKGSLSSHISKLKQARLVAIEKLRAEDAEHQHLPDRGRPYADHTALGTARPTQAPLETLAMIGRRT